MSQDWAEAITTGDLLLRAAERHPDDDAVVFPDERLNWSRLAARARWLARGLVGLGVEPGDHVGVLMANSPDCIASIYAIGLAGAVLVPINTRYRASELPYVVTDAGLVAILTSDRIDDYVDLPGLLTESLPGLAAGAPEPPRLRSVVLLGQREVAGMMGERALDQYARGVSEAEIDACRARVRVRQTALILYTSGTTSQPRGCVLTHESIVRNWTQVATTIYRMTEADRLWAPCPLFHLGAIGPLLMCAATGAAFLSDTFFDAGRAVELIARERATVLYPAYPPITQAVLTHPSFDAAALPQARAMLNVAPPDTLRQMQAALPQAIQLSLYGLTEGGGPLANSRLDDREEVRMETVGAALPGGEVRIVDPATRESVPVGDPGEIAIRGVSVCDGYHGDPEKTAAQFDDAGWYYTGDRGSLDAAGRLRFLGRLKDMLKVGGENVAPAEVEAHLALHPAVKLAQVVGVPDARLDEVVAAFVELRPGMTVTEDDLLDHCRGQIARFKEPRYIRFVTEWPTSATKVQKERLRTRLLGELEPTKR